MTPETDDAKKRLESFEDEIIDRLFVLNDARAEEEGRRGSAAGRRQRRLALSNANPAFRV